MKRIFSMVLVLSLLISGISVAATAEGDTKTDETAASASATSTEEAKDTSTKINYVERMSYKDYLEKNSGVASGTDEVVIDASMISNKTSGVQLKQNYNGFKGTAIYTTESDSVEFKFNAKAGLYNLYMEYYTEPGKNVSIERAVYVNGEIPFSVAEGVTFSRAWKDKLVTDENGKEDFATDIYGNNTTPEQVEVNKWMSTYFYDYLGYYAEPLQFNFKDGENTLKIESVKEPVTIGTIKLLPIKEYTSYSDYKAECEKNGYEKYSGEEVIMEAEYAYEKSEQTIYPSADVSSPSASLREGDASAYVMKINSIDGNNWKSSQQSISWKVSDDLKAGLYSLNFKVRKNVSQDMMSTRKLYINGNIPFKEASEIIFKYSSNWTIVSPETEDGEKCLVYIQPGDIITLEATLGEMGPIINEAEVALKNVNTIYRNILMITGSKPDKVRDYHLDDLIPGVIEDMNTEAERLDSIVDRIYNFTGQKGSDLATIEKLSRQLKKMNNDPDCVAKQLEFFKTNIGAYGTWINSASGTPLSIDYISLSAPDAKIKKANKGFFSGFAYEVNRFIASFTVDYNAIGSMSEIKSNDDDVITVWIQSGRDQFQILRSLINNSYTAQTGNQVNLELVNVGALLSAVVAGIGPDVAIGQPKNEPINFALRNAVYDLSTFSDIEDIKSRFSSESLVPYYFDDGNKTGLYALPETQNFDMLFYRKDILADLGLGIPNTWTDVISCITVLSKNNMEFGLPIQLADQATSFFNSLLLQNGGKMYNDDNMSTALQSTEATIAFKQWTNFYVNYDLPVEFDFQNRFRTGEMPLGVSNYTLYNTLSVAAPEIRGLWGFTLIPGIQKEDGSIDRSDTLTTTASIILKDNTNTDLSWEFLKWWTSAEAQADFGNRLECILGPSARYTTANLEAFESLPWSSSEISEINKQLETCYSMPEIAGSYFITRHVMNAFRRVKYKDQDPKDTLYDYSNVINSEITNKRSEFGLPTLGD